MLTEALGRSLCDGCRSRRAARIIDAAPTSPELIRSTVELIGVLFWRATFATALLQAPIIVLAWFVLPPAHAQLYGYAWWVVAVVADMAVVQMAVAIGRDEQPRLFSSLLASCQRWPILAATMILYWGLMFVGFIALIIPGAIAACMFAIACPIAMMEHVGPIEAMRRSARRTLGYRWHYFAAALALGAVGYAGSFVVGLGTTSLSEIATSDSVPTTAGTVALYAVSFLLSGIVAPIVNLPARILPAALYLKLSTDPDPDPDHVRIQT